MRNHEKNSEKLRMKPVLIGLGACFAAAVICTIILAVLVVNERIGEPLAESLIYVILVLSSLFGSWIAGSFTGKMTPLPAIAVSAIFGCILLVLGLLLFDGKLISPVMKMVAIAAGCVITSVTTGKGRHNLANKKKRYR